MATRPCVLVFAGHDPSGGAGIHADIEAIAAPGAHALTIITALTEQDNDHVYAVQPLDANSIIAKATRLTSKIPISAVKIGIVGNRANAQAIAECIGALRRKQPDLPVVLDPVLGSGHGDTLAAEDAVEAVRPLFALATLMTPNLPEMKRLCPHAASLHECAQEMMRTGCAHILIKGGHGDGEDVCNNWYSAHQVTQWSWPRLPGSFHGSGCTLASAIAAQLALGRTMQDALEQAQNYCQHSLQQAYAITRGQLIPGR